jgi:hypothetical protein
MNIRQAIELLLARLNNTYPEITGFFGAAGGAVGSINILQRDANSALKQWRETGSTDGLRQLADTLHLTGRLTDTDYQQIMEVLDGE